MKNLTLAMKNALMNARRNENGNYRIGRVDSRTMIAFVERGLVFGTWLTDAGLTERAMLIKGYE